MTLFSLSYGKLTLTGFPLLEPAEKFSILEKTNIFFDLFHTVIAQKWTFFSIHVPSLLAKR